jgi:hypothetical protein
MSDFRKLLATRCWSCVIDIVGWRDPNETEWPQQGWINIGLISNHDFAQFGSWRGKLRRIAHALRGETYRFLEFHCREDVAAFVAAIREAADTVLPSAERLA